MMVSILKNHLDPRAVCPRVEARTMEAVVGVLAERLLTLGIVTPTWRAAVVQREASMPTGLPLSDDFAVAVPHTDPEHVVRPGLAIATLAAPVAFRSMDDPDVVLPVRIVFALALRDKRQQIDMLQAIAELLQSPERLMRIAAAADGEELLSALDKALEPVGGEQ